MNIEMDYETDTLNLFNIGQFCLVKFKWFQNREKYILLNWTENNLTAPRPSHYNI